MGIKAPLRFGKISTTVSDTESSLKDPALRVCRVYAVIGVWSGVTD
jgi:hypothetical protein